MIDDEAPVGEHVDAQDHRGLLGLEAEHLEHRQVGDADVAIAHFGGIDLFRRTDLTRDWLASALAAGPGRLLYAGRFDIA